MACGAIWFTWIAARELVGERDAWVAAGLMALAGPLVFMAGQLKPYAGDAFFAALLVSRLLRHDRLHSRRTFVELLVTGVAAPLFSLGAVFMLAGGGVFLVTRVPWRSLEWRRLLEVFAAWALAAVVAIALTRRLLSPATESLMHAYWMDSFPPRQGVDFAWSFRRLLDLLWTVMGLRGVRIVGIVLVVAATITWRKRPAVVLLLGAPLVAAMASAMLRQYPFGHRLLLWAVPLVALLLTIAVARASNLVAGRPLPVVAFPGLLALAAPAMALANNPPPYLRDDVRPVIDMLASRSRPGDAVYIYWGAWHTWERYGAKAGATGEVYRGGCPVDYPRGYLRELDQFRGKPGVWFLFGRMQYDDEHRMLLDYLQAIGVRTDSVVVEAVGLNYTPRVDLHRFDLRDTLRQLRTDAETFPIPPGLARTETGCPRIDAMFVRADGSRVVPLF
jgi:hypothetical protein